MNSQPCYLTKDYNFLAFFECLQTLKCQEISVDSIFETIKATVSEDELRDIFWSGIKQHWKHKNDFHIISNLCEKFRRQKLLQMRVNTSNQQRDTIENGNNTNSVFSIQSITCNIFSFLDLKSFSFCNRVNKQWLYDSYCPLSTYHLNFASLCTNTNNSSLDIMRFKQISSLQIYIPSSAVSFENINATRQILNSLQKYKNIKKFEWIASNHQLSMIFELISNNKDNLRQLYLRNVKFNSSFSIGSRLETLTVTKSKLAPLFWQTMASDSVDLINLKELKLAKCSDNDNINSSQESVSESHMAGIATKLANVRKIFLNSPSGLIGSRLIPHIRGENLKNLVMSVNAATILSIMENRIKCNFTCLEKAVFVMQCEKVENAQRTNIVTNHNVAQGLSVIDRICRIISFSTAGEDININSQHNRLSNIKLLFICNLKIFGNISGIEVYKKLNCITFNRLQECSVSQNILATNRWQEVLTLKKMIDWLDLIDTSHNKSELNEKITYSVNYMYWDVNLVKHDQELLQHGMNKLIDYIVKSNCRDGFVFRIKFVDKRSNVMHFDVPYKFATMLGTKLTGMDCNNNDHNHETPKLTALEKENFVAPFYGGDSDGFDNVVTLCDKGKRVKLHVKYNTHVQFTFQVRIENNRE